MLSTFYRSDNFKKIHCLLSTRSNRGVMWQVYFSYWGNLLIDHTPKYCDEFPYSDLFCALVRNMQRRNTGKIFLLGYGMWNGYSFWESKVRYSEHIRVKFEQYCTWTCKECGLVKIRSTGTGITKTQYGNYAPLPFPLTVVSM